MSAHHELYASGALLLVAMTTACAENPPKSESNQTGSRDAYDFQLPESGDEMVRVDAVGVALVSTVLMNRDRTATGKDNENRYQAATPDVQNQPNTLVAVSQ